MICKNKRDGRPLTPRGRFRLMKTCYQPSQQALVAYYTIDINKYDLKPSSQSTTVTSPSAAATANSTIVDSMSLSLLGDSVR
jgi:hypothetical protein